MGDRVDLDFVEGAWVEVRPSVLCPARVVLDMRNRLADTLEGVPTDVEASDAATLVRAQNGGIAMTIVWAEWAVEKFSIPGLPDDTAVGELPLPVFDALSDRAEHSMRPPQKPETTNDSESPEP